MCVQKWENIIESQNQIYYYWKFKTENWKHRNEKQITEKQSKKCKHYSIEKPKIQKLKARNIGKHQIRQFTSTRLIRLWFFNLYWVGARLLCRRCNIGKIIVSLFSFWSRSCTIARWCMTDTFQQHNLQCS